jgi:hypothetical protein
MEEIKAYKIIIMCLVLVIVGMVITIVALREDKFSEDYVTECQASKESGKIELIERFCE